MIVDILEILFKSNASDVKKDTAEAKKSVDQFQEAIDKNDKTIKEIGSNLLNMAVDGLAAFATFQGLKEGIQQSNDLNANLARTSLLTGEQADKIEALDAAIARTSGNRGEIAEWFKGYAKYLQSIGRTDLIKNVIPDIEEMADLLKSLPLEEARNRFAQFQQQTGIPDSVLQSIINEKDSLRGLVEEEQKLNLVTKESTDLALKSGLAWSKVGADLIAFWSQVTTALDPIFSRIAKWLHGSLISNGMHEDVYHLFGSHKTQTADTSKRQTADTSDGIKLNAPNPFSPPSLAEFPAVLGKSDQGIQSTFNSKSVYNQPTVNINGVTVNTLANDPQGVADAVKNMLKNEYRHAISQYDDGIAR